MPSERHINRQIQWRDTLRKYGANTSLERTIRIKGARVVVDVYAEIEGKIFLIEIGDINDERKTALMSYYAQEKPNVEFIHEPYGSNKMPKVLESISVYRNSEEYKQHKLLEKLREEKFRERQKREGNIKMLAFCLFFFSIFVFLFASIVPEPYVIILAMMTVLMWFGGFGLWLFSGVIAGIETKSPTKQKPVFTSEQHGKACLKWVKTELEKIEESKLQKKRNKMDEEEENMSEYCTRCGCELPDPDEIYWLYGQPYCEDCYNDEIEETDYPFIEDL